MAKTRNKNAEVLIGKVVSDCCQHKINLQFVNKPYVMAEGLKCSGYFDNTNLVVATDKGDWIDVLIHESCHMDQFIQNAPCYNKGDCGIQLIDKWLSGKQYSKQRMYDAFCDTILMELDCEKRSVKKIKKYKIQINIEKYIQQVNSYLFSYWAAARDRKWYPQPYNNPYIVKNMPKVFLPINQYIDSDTCYLKFFNEKSSQTS